MKSSELAIAEPRVSPNPRRTTKLCFPKDIAACLLTAAHYSRQDLSTKSSYGHADPVEPTIKVAHLIEKSHAWRCSEAIESESNDKQQAFVRVGEGI